MPPVRGTAMPKIGRVRRVTSNADADRWRRRAEAYERLVHMIRRAEQYVTSDGDSIYGPTHRMRELHEALLVLGKYKVIELNKGLSGVDELALWKAIELWKKSADSIEAIDRAAEQIRGCPPGWPNTTADDPWACTCGVWGKPREHGENPIHAVDCAVHFKPDPTDHDDPWASEFGHELKHQGEGWPPT